MSIYSLEEQVLLRAWLASRPIDGQLDVLLRKAGFEDDLELYSRLDCWVGSFAAAEDDKRLTTLPRLLFSINWAESGPGVSRCLTPIVTD